jgi:hypothetical protein
MKNDSVKGVFNSISNPGDLISVPGPLVLWEHNKLGLDSKYVIIRQDPVILLVLESTQDKNVQGECLVMFHVVHEGRKGWVILAEDDKPTEIVKFVR